MLSAARRADGSCYHAAMAEPKIDVVIPVLGCPAVLGETLAALGEARAAGLLGEVRLVSGDGDAGLAARFGGEARILTAAPGRGQQLAAGAAASEAPWLLFLHADTRLESGWAAEAADFIADPGNAERAAAFRLAFDATHLAARIVAAVANWRSRRLPYGDQGLLISRAFYERLGGFRPLVIMEDVELMRRIGRRRLRLLETPAVTSAARYRRDGWWLRPLRNLSVLALYFLGVPPKTLRRLYG